MRAFLLGAALLATSACAGNDSDPSDMDDPSNPDEDRQFIVSYVIVSDSKPEVISYV